MSRKIGVLLGCSPAGTTWHAAQRPGRVFARHAPDGYLRKGSRFGSVRIVGFGLRMPTCLLRVGAPGDHRGVRWPTLGGVELPTALSSRFVRSAQRG